MLRATRHGGARQTNLVLHTIAAYNIPNSRRAECLCHFPVIHCVDNILWIDRCRTTSVHCGDHRGNSHRAIEDSEQRKTGQIDFPRLNLILLLKLFDL